MKSDIKDKIEEINAKYIDFGFKIAPPLNQDEIDTFTTTFESKFGIKPHKQITDFLKLTNGIDSPTGWAALGLHPDDPTFDIFNVNETNRKFNGVSSDLICVATGDSSFIGYNISNKMYEVLILDRLKPYNKFRSFEEVLKHILDL